MDAAGLLFAGLTLLVGALVGFLQRASPDLEELRGMIRDELGASYSELASALSKEPVVYEELAQCTTRLKRLHSAVLDDSAYIRRTDAVLKCALPVGLAGVVVAWAATAAGLWVLRDKLATAGSLVAVAVPFALLVTECIYACVVAQHSRTLKRLAGKYRRMEY